jgi:DNA-binding SARP family transcriptional activator
MDPTAGPVAGRSSASARRAREFVVPATRRGWLLHDVHIMRGVSVEVLVLGPVRIRRAGTVVAPPSVLTRTVVAALALAGSAGLTVDALSDAAWPADRQPGRSAVGVAVHRARRWLADTTDDQVRIEYAISRYRLVGATVDADRFLALAADDPVGALALWRGEPLADAAPGPATEPALARLARARLDAATRHGRSLLASGRAGAAVETLLPLADRFPFDEPLHAALIEALAAAGRQADALARYERIRLGLAEQLGVDPSRELSAALVRVLRQEVPGAAQPTASGVPAQLPQDVGGFSGRTAELATLDRFADDGAPVLVSALSGIGGVGKTALAVHWAHRVTTAFPDGQLYVDLRGFSQSPPVRPIDVLGRFLRALGLTADQVPMDVDEAATTYRTLLSGRRMLVLLDNAADVDQVRPLLPGSAACRVVVTSRNRLDGLVAREGARRLDVDVFQPDESVELVRMLLGADRVAAERDAVERLAQLCGHLPLALRIACATILGDPGRTVADQVASLATSRLTGLTTEGDALSSIRVVFGLSYDRLSTQDQRLLRLLALAPGGDISGPAVAQLAGLSESDAKAGLDRLAAEHLVTVTGDRFSLHDLVREYAAELAETDDGGVARLCRWYLAVAEAASRRLYPDTSPTPLPDDLGLPEIGELDGEAASAVFSAEMANLVAVVEHAAEHGPYEIAWLLAYTLRIVFWHRGHHLEWSVVAAAASRAADLAGSAMGRAMAAAGAASLARCVGRPADAARQYRAGLSEARAAGWADGVGAMLNGLGCAMSESGDPVGAAEVLREGVRHAREIGSTAAEATTAGNLAVVYMKTGQLAEAAALSRELVDLCVRTDNRHSLAHVLINLGSTYGDLGRLADARATLRDAEEALGDGQDRAATVRLNLLARVAADAGDPDEVAELAGRAIEGAHALSDRRQETIGVLLLATAHRLRGEYDKAVLRYGEAIDLARGAGHTECEAESRCGLALAWHAVGRQDEALDQARYALTLCHEGGYDVNESDVVTALGRIHLARGELEWATTQVERALAICQRTGTRLREARAWSVLAQVRHAQHRPDDAAAAARRASELFAETGGAESTLDEPSRTP